MIFSNFSKNFILIFNENFDFPKKYVRKFPKIVFRKNNFRSQKINIFFLNEICFCSNPMSRPSSSCIFGSSGPVEVSERGSYIFLILLCFLKKLAGSRTYPPEPDHIHETNNVLSVTFLAIPPPRSQ